MNTLRRFLPSGLGGLAGLACALRCVISLLAAGILGGTTWVLLGQILPGFALGLAALTGMAFWWSRRKRLHVTGCSGGNCSCATTA